MGATQWKIKPQLDVPSAGIWLGPGATRVTDGLWLGQLAENVTGKTPSVWVTTGKEQVIGLFGKRGSGKSFTLGTLLEGLAVKSDATHVAKGSQRKAALLFDPLDIYWTTRFPAVDSSNSEAKRHYQLAKAARLDGLEFEVEAWVPGLSSRRTSDPAWFKSLTVATSELGLDEWGMLLDTDVVREPMGQALVEMVALAGTRGFEDQAGTVRTARPLFAIADLIAATKSVEAENGFHPETLRALRQRLSALDATGLFDETGNPLRSILRAGRLSVVLLARLPIAYRIALVSVLTRQLIDERADVAFAAKRLALDPTLSDDERSNLEQVVKSGVPRTVVALDEAQTFLAPGTSNAARDIFVRLVKEGRNIGLSAILATQQPSALDKRILSQIETFLSHQLVTASDIDAVVANLKSATPDSIDYGQNSLSFADMLRMLSPGQCIVSAADMNTTLRRTIAVNVRPRATIHGGIEL